MNSISADPTAPPPPLPVLQPPRSSFSCDRHPSEIFTGFCPSCLCERLTSLDNSSSNTPSSSRRPSSASAAAAAAIKSLFTTNSKSSHFPPPAPVPKLPKPATFAPQLRRTKSFSASKNENLGFAFEPQRKSCDVRGRSTLWSLFSIDDKNPIPSSSLILGSSSQPNKPAPREEIQNVEDLVEPEIEETLVDVVYNEENEVVDEEIKPVVVEEESHLGKIEMDTVQPLKPTESHIELQADPHLTEKKNPGAGFWAAASVFSKKWQKWRQKQKTKKQSNGHKYTTLPVEKPISHQFRETQSEIADYGFGRRSCDTDPRFSLDAARISIDDPRYSFEEPRASWDGYLLAKTSSRLAPMVSVMEDAPHYHVPRSDMQIPVDEPPVINDSGDGIIPGGSAQTREYYSDSRRRKSLDRSSSIRKTAAAVIAEIDELKNGDYFHGGNKVILGERELRDSNSTSLRDDCSESFELGGGVRGDSSSSILRNGVKKSSKKSRRWSWKIWGFIHKRHKDEDEEGSRGNGVGRSYSESWHDLRTGDLRNGLSRNISRSNSSVSWRNGNHKNQNGGSVAEMNGSLKNRSARYSPGHFDNGLRFYFAPMKSRRGGGMNNKIKTNGSHSIARSVLRLY